MKIKMGVIALFVIAMLSYPFVISADSGGYIVKLKEGTYPVELANMLTEVSAKHQIYKADSTSQLEPYSEYIEYTEANNEVMLIEGEEEITQARKKYKRIFYKEEPHICPGIVKALKNADLIILSTGSMLTSLIPNITCKEVAEAIKKVEV